MYCPYDCCHFETTVLPATHWLDEDLRNHAHRQHSPPFPPSPITSVPALSVGAQPALSQCFHAGLLTWLYLLGQEWGLPDDVIGGTSASRCVWFPQYQLDHPRKNRYFQFSYLIKGHNLLCHWYPRTCKLQQNFPVMSLAFFFYYKLQMLLQILVSGATALRTHLNHCTNACGDQYQ